MYCTILRYNTIIAHIFHAILYTSQPTPTDIIREHDNIK